MRFVSVFVSGVLSASLSASLVVTAPGAVAATKVDPLRVLNSLPVSGEVTGGYDRDLFRHWSDLDGDGCDTREEVLMAEAKSGSIRGCRVVGGRWISLFDGATTSNPSSFDIDHFVPLKEAWDSGAWRWNANTRERFANDLGFAGSLIAVSASSNRSKSDRDPTDWLPRQSVCLYAKTWVGVKFRWRLSVDSREKQALNRILSRCPGKMTLPSRAATSGSQSRPASQNANGSNNSNSSSNSNGSNSSGAAANSGGQSTSRDPRFTTCGEAIAAGYGPYLKGKDPEYSWYIDRDKDGAVCES